MSKHGKLYVCDGCDGSGKKTQIALLYERLAKEGFNVIKIDFPNYKSESSALVKMYLNGEFGTDPNAVNAYTASTFYAVDRFASYKKEWENFYLEGGIVLADRYTTSNMIHQIGKFDTLAERESYLEWLWDLEFIKMGLPVPDKVFFLDVKPETTLKLMENRDNKITGEKQKDIHERNTQHLIDAYNNAQYLIKKYSWAKIDCNDSEKLIKSIDDIHNEIYKQVINNI